jgi:hypothetical protein
VRASAQAPPPATTSTATPSNTHTTPLTPPLLLSLGAGFVTPPPVRLGDDPLVVAPEPCGAPDPPAGAVAPELCPAPLECGGTVTPPTGVGSEVRGETTVGSAVP